MLAELKPAPGSRRPRRRKGRGIGSGHGRTCGRGQKGAGARSGHKKRPWAEGGQMPLARRLPKFGFRNIFRSPRQLVNLCDLARFDADSTIDIQVLAEARLVSKRHCPVKLLGKGEVAQALCIRLDAVSESARKKIEAAGGSIEITPAPRRNRKKAEA